ncbi:MAG TPA: hypothetical protein PKC10_07520 [Cyclobacteriaceae bacterium]|nr:hypothetical protein [Cyclobacteriaceae bacterium]
MKKAIQTLVFVSKPQTVIHPQLEHPVRFRLSFITLTLPSQQAETSDKELIKNGLEPFLLWCRRKHKVKHYIWKAERQKNGNLHFHITTNRFIYYQEVQDEWNFHLQKFGMIDRFQAKHGHRSPHSTEIKAVKKMDEIERYLQKYYMKNLPDDQKINGKVWDCSLSLKSVPWPSVVIDNSVNEDIEYMAGKLFDRRFEGDMCTAFWWTERERNKMLPGWALQKLEQFRHDVLTFERTAQVSK